MDLTTPAESNPTHYEGTTWSERENIKGTIIVNFDYIWRTFVTKHESKRVSLVKLIMKKKGFNCE